VIVLVVVGGGADLKGNESIFCIPFDGRGIGGGLHAGAVAIAARYGTGGHVTIEVEGRGRRGGRQGDAVGDGVLVKGIAGPVVRCWQDKCAAGGFGAVPDAIILIDAIRGRSRGVIGADDLTESIILPSPVRLRACKGTACGSHGLALGDGIHAVSVTGDDGSSSFIFDAAQRIAGGLIRAIGGENGAGIAGDSVGHGILLEIGTAGGSCAQVTGSGLGVGVAVGEGGGSLRDAAGECGVMPDVLQAAHVIIRVAGGVLGDVGGGSQVERNGATNGVVIAIEISVEAVHVLLFKSQA